MTKTWRDVFGWCLIGLNALAAVALAIGLYKNSLDTCDRFFVGAICMLFFAKMIWSEFLSWAIRNKPNVKHFMVQRQAEETLKTLKKYRDSLKG